MPKRTQYLHFSVVPLEETSLPPCRNINIENEPYINLKEHEDRLFIDQDICMAEGLVDISAPIKIGKLRENLFSPEYGSYYYAGPYTMQVNQGVWGRNYVVDPIISHGEGYDQFVAERVYADNGNNWMEAGWTEKSWLDDRQYIYAMDSNLAVSILFEEYNISTGSQVETRVYYNSEVGKWRATYYIGGDSWIVLREELIGFTIADHGYNLGEFWENIGIVPLILPSIFDKGYLLIDGIWKVWDARFNTDVTIDLPYQLDMINKYYQFSIYSPLIYLPIVIEE